MAAGTYGRCVLTQFSMLNRGASSSNLLTVWRHLLRALRKDHAGACQRRVGQDDLTERNADAEHGTYVIG